MSLMMRSMDGQAEDSFLVQGDIFAFPAGAGTNKAPAEAQASVSAVSTPAAPTEDSDIILPVLNAENADNEEIWKDIESVLNGASNSEGIPGGMEDELLKDMDPDFWLCDIPMYDLTSDDEFPDLSDDQILEQILEDRVL